MGLVVFLICLILAGTAIFYYWEYYETPVEKWDEAEYSKPEHYIEKQTDKGILIENKKAGISFMVPSGWRVEKEKYLDYIALFSQGAEEESFIVKNGCKIKAEVRNIKVSLASIEQALRIGHKSWGDIDQYEIIVVGRHRALKNVTGITSLAQYYVGIHVPVKNMLGNKVYSFGVNANIQDQEECTQAFEQFLKTVVIK